MDELVRAGATVGVLTLLTGVVCALVFYLGKWRGRTFQAQDTIPLGCGCISLAAVLLPTLLVAAAFALRDSLNRAS